ncbi:hypothetical protein [Olivibacter sitiensis]|uniref:hypothetical protein n=1 Tax=Olivibacter sitiensis TaxID=376470 RepID=UPI0004020F18|nr:hypothetical protein [Olivibacter sitiensis]
MEPLRPNTYYHIYNHANGDDNLFRERKNYSFFLAKYEKHIAPIADTIAWCLMPNHFHLLVRIKSEEDLATAFPTSLAFPKFQTLEKLSSSSELSISNFLSKQFSNFFSSYTQSFNKEYKRRGSLFLKNFKRKKATNDAYLQALVLYIHLNPVKHGFTSGLDDWEWTSYHDVPKRFPILVTHFFGDEEQYQSRHQEKISFFAEYLKLENELT